MLTQSSIHVIINNEKLSFCALRRDRATIDFDNLWDFSLKKLWLWSLFVHSSQKVDKSFIFTTLMGFNRSRTARVWISVSQDQPTWRTKRINFSVLMVCGLGRELTTTESGDEIRAERNLLFIGNENSMKFWLLLIVFNRNYFNEIAEQHFVHIFLPSLPVLSSKCRNTLFQSRVEATGRWTHCTDGVLSLHEYQAGWVK